MTTGATGQLGLALPVQGELSGTWGNTVNNGITEYTNIAIAATLTLTDDGAVTLANTTGDASATNITSSLTGAGTVTAQFAIVKVTGTLTTTKVITGPSYSKTYVVDNTTATYGVTFKASGQTGVTVVAGEKCTVYYNGTDYVKVASSVADGVTAVSVASANGFAGSSSGGGTPALTISTSVNGIAKGDGSALSAATAGTDYVAPGGALGTPSSGTLSGCTVDGTYSVGFRKIPPVGAKTSSYTLAAADAGKFVEIQSGGSIVVPAATFSSGDAVTIYNNTTGNITITTSAVSAYLAGTNALKTSVTLATRGVSNILFYSGSDCVITGNVS